VPLILNVLGAGGAIVTRRRPTTVWYVAVISTSPAATADTTPPAVALAMVPSEELQVATFVTVNVVPSDSVAVAENGAVAPTTGAEPATATETTVEAAGVLELDVGAVGGGAPLQAISREAGAIPARSVRLCTIRRSGSLTAASYASFSIDAEFPFRRTQTRSRRTTAGYWKRCGKTL
jgi:hypothetical protein